MEDNAMISLSTIQYAEEGEDKIELVTKGRFAEKDGKYYIIYEESEVTGFEGTTTTIKVSKDKMTLTRRGRFNSRMEFVKGEKRLCNYPTPYGAIPVAVDPLLLEANLGSGGGTVDVTYLLDLSNQLYAKNQLKLKVELLPQ